MNWAMKVLLAVSLFVSMLFLGTSRASADSLTFDFTGDCLDCTNPQGVLVLQNYTLGDEITYANFVSFTYTSNLADVSVTSANLGTAEGVVGSTSGNNNFAIEFGSPTYTFQLATDGTWCYGSTGTCSVVCMGDSCGGGIIGIDHGTDGAFTLETPSSVPEPSSLLLLGSGLTALAAVRRRFDVRVRGRRDGCPGVDC
jgi:hypothetical protein